MTHYKVSISATSEEEARMLLKMLVDSHLVAGGLITKGDSIHWWKGKIDEEPYWHISAFTIESHKDKIISKVEENHKDDVPVIEFYIIDSGNSSFLEWIDENTTLD